MKLLVRIVIVAALTVGITVAATNVTGKWNGKISTDISKLPKETDPQKADLHKKMIAQLATLKITLVLSANKTYTLTTIAPGKTAPVQHGTWSVSGNTLTLNIKGRDGAQHPQQFTLSKDGKTLSAAQKGAMKITFTR